MKTLKMFVILAILASGLVFGQSVDRVAAEQPPPTFDYGHLESNDVPSIAPVREQFTVSDGYIAAIWWKIEGLGDYVGLWLGSGTYNYTAAGRVRFWNVAKLTTAQIAELKKQWQAVVQYEAGSEAPDYVWTDLTMSGVAVDWGSLQVSYVQQFNGIYTIADGQLACVWWKPTVNDTSYVDCTGVWLYPGTYEVSASEGAMRVWNISTLDAAGVAALKSWWEPQVQATKKDCTYSWTQLGK